MNAVVYLCQVSACMGIFYLFYYVPLSRFTFFTINRWYLLVTMALSFVIPLLTITVQQQEAYPEIIQKVVYVNQLQMPAEPMVITAAPEPVSTPFNWMDTLKVFYTVSVLALSIRLIIIVAKFLTKMRNKKRTKVGGVQIVRGDKSLNNGSFFNYIFLNGDELTADEMQQIIAHEMLHVKLYHSVDRILVKIAQIFLWFNPFVYLYARAIEQNHEFEVDREVGNATDKNKYAELLLHLSVASGGTLYHNFSMVPLKKRITMLFTKPTHKMKKVIYLLVVPVVLISCLAFAKLKSGEAEKRKVQIEEPAVANSDTSKIRYRQKSKLTPAQRKANDEARAKSMAYMESAEGKKKMEQANAVQGKEITVTVLRDYKNEKDLFKGNIVRDNSTGAEFLLPSWYGQSKQLNTRIKQGDELTIKVFSGGVNQESPVSIMPAYVKKNGKKIFELAEAGKIPDYPFLYEANKVRFADGQITRITKYPNGKWKTAVFERVNGYKFNLSFKPDAPNLNSIADGDHVTLRFVHEVKTGAKTYKITDWVAISTDIKDYGIKNPDFFSKFYEMAKADDGKLSMIDGINNLGPTPLVVINGKEYGKEILYKISTKGMGGWSFYPPNNGSTKYGEKAKDGAVIIDYRNGDITYMSDTDKNNLKKRQDAKRKFFSRITLNKEDGSEYDLAVLNRVSGSNASAELSRNGKIAFIINNKVYNETDFTRLFPKDKTSYGPSIGVSGVTNELRERGLKLDGYELVFQFDLQNWMSPLNAPVKTGFVGAQKKVTSPISATEPKDTVSKGVNIGDKLIGKIPGAEVKADGTLWFNGKPVKTARINGVEYSERE